MKTNVAISGNKRPLGVGVALALNGELGGVAAYWTRWIGHCVQRYVALFSSGKAQNQVSVMPKV